MENNNPVKPKPVVKSTIMQRRLAKIVVEESGSLKSKKEAVLRAGYSKAVAIDPQRVFESPGFLAALAEYGLTVKLVASALVDDINLKPGDRIKELDLAAEILSLKNKESQSQIFEVNINTDRDNYA